MLTYSTLTKHSLTYCVDLKSLPYRHRDQTPIKPHCIDQISTMHGCSMYIR